MLVFGYLGTLPGSTGRAEQDHAVVLQLLQQTLPEPPHGPLPPLLQERVVARGEGQPVVGVHLQLPQLLGPLPVLVLPVTGEEGGHGQGVQGG